MKQRLTFFFLLMLTVTAMAQNKKVAVWDTKCSDNSISAMQRVMVRGGMEAAVANAPGYTGFDRASFDAIIREHNFQRSGAVSDNDIKRLGEMAGVQYIIVPEAMADGKDFYIIVKMLDVESGEFGAAYEELCTTSATDIKNACAKLGSQLFGTSYSGGGNYGGSSGGTSSNGGIIGQLLSKVLVNVTALLGDGGRHIGDTDKPGFVLQYDPAGNLYCGGYGYSSQTTTIGMYVAAEGYELANCPDSWIYVGKYKNGIKEGEGLVYDRDGNLIYSGKFSNDKPTGKYPDSYARTVISCSAFDMGNGDYYIGETIEGVLDGCGLYIWSDGDAWWGFWKDGEQNGPGIMMNYNGSYFTGTWKNGKKVSNDIEFSTAANKSQSQPDLADVPWIQLLRKATTNAPKKWNDGDRAMGYRDADGGIGLYLFGDGSFYAGQFTDYEFTGLGMFVVQSDEIIISNCPDGFAYVGNFKKGVKHGKYGVVYNKYGKIIYKGEFRDGKPVDLYPSSEYTLSTYSNKSFGVYVHDNGDIYLGEYKDGVRSGVGLYLWANGSSWVGNFNNGSRNGFGCQMFYDGTYHYGKWENDAQVK